MSRARKTVAKKRTAAKEPAAPASVQTPGVPPLTGRDAHIARLRAGETVSFREGGNSMTPRIKHRQKCTYAPVASEEDVSVGDAVFCKVGGSYFTHLVGGVKGAPGDRLYKITNNHGHTNGWIPVTCIFGRVTAIED